MLSSAHPAYAGFEWQAPAARQAPAPAPAQQRPADMMMEAAPAVPAPPVMPAPMTTTPPMAQPESKTEKAGLFINPYPKGQSDTSDDALTDALLSQSGMAQAKPAPTAPVSPVVRESQYPVIQGFGRDIPLAIALSQVVPQGYTYAFDPAVDPGVSVSWQGGQPWDQVLNNMLVGEGYKAGIKGQQVRIGTASSMKEEVHAAAPMVASVKETPPADDLAKAMAAPAPVPQPEPQPVASYAPPAHPVMVSRASDLGNDVRERPVMPARLSRMQDDGVSAVPPPSARELKEPVPVPVPEGNDMMVEPEEVMAQDAPVSVVPAPVAATPLEEKPEAVEPVVSAPVVSSKPMEWKEPREFKMASVPGVNDYKARKTWRAVRGDSLRDVLIDWSEQAGVDLTWDSEYDYPLQASARIEGTFEDAVQSLLTGLQDARPRPVGRLHPNLPDGPPALIIETQQILE
jgi:hypothetical protein